MSDYDAPAAVQAVAEMGKEAIAAARDAGGFVREVSGSTPENAFGLINDWLKFKRANNVISYSQRLATNCKEAGIDPSRLDSPTPSIIIPLLEAASMEERDELIDLWDKLLLAAIDPKTRSRVRARHIQIIKQLEPLDALILKHFEMLATNAQAARINTQSGLVTSQDFSAAVGKMVPHTSEDDVHVSIGNLEELKLVQKNAYAFPNMLPAARNLLTVLSRK